MDDVINVAGHRLGTAEVEGALVENPAVAEAAVVGFPHEIKGTGGRARTMLYACISDIIDFLFLHRHLRLRYLEARHRGDWLPAG